MGHKLNRLQGIDLTHWPMQQQMKLRSFRMVIVKEIFNETLLGKVGHILSF